MAISGANLSPDGLDSKFREEYREHNRVQPDPLVTLMLTEPDIDPRLLESIRVPVLVTAGEYDLILPEETQRIVRHLPNAKLAVVEGENHGSYIANNETMGRLLIGFFGSL